MLGVLALPVSASAEDAAINFRDVEVMTAIESIASITGKTFIVDPRVRGKVSIVSADPISEETLYDVFLSALKVQGFQAVSNGSTVSILPAARAATLSDQSGSEEFITEVLRIKNSKAASISATIAGMLSTGAKVTVHEESNSLVVTDTESQLNRFKAMLNELDTERYLNYDIVRLSNIQAKEIVSMALDLGLIDHQTKVVEDMAANRLIISGPLDSRRKIKDLIRQLDGSQQSGEQSGFDVIYLNHAKADTLQPLLEGMLSSSAFKKLASPAAAGDGSAAEGNAGKESFYSIQADIVNNALIVGAPANVMAAIKTIVEKLDKPRPQVLIEAVIAEVSEEFFDQFSVNLAALGNYGVFVTDFSGALSTLGSAVGGSTSDQAAAIGSVTATPTFGAANVSGNRGIGGLIQAIKTDNKSSLLSTPSILTLENEAATISIGKEIPFITGSFTTNTAGASNPFQTIERKEVGTILKVRPQISNDGSIRLEIDQEVSNIDQTNIQGTSGTNPTTDKKVIETNVLVQDGQTLVLGGLIDSKFSNIESKVPLLGDVPVLGSLFRSKQRSKESSILMVFIRPTIVDSAEQGNQLTRQKYRLYQGRHSEFISRNQLESELGGLPEDLSNIHQLDQFVE
ncbi:type II secretion system secretin GspD [Marinobacterium sp. YM272]|uniref:type II secretion system secretin GspD n=1 Tax=Marinobacterium sp. YM272 TaxID=3421654 RepID=UPI003D7F7972